MRKILILLLVVGFLLGTFPVADVICEESSLQGVMDIMGDEGLGGLGDPAPCGQGGSGGGGCPG